MLPFLEQAPLYSSANFNLNADFTQNTTVQNTKINSFLCPSDSNAGRIGINSYYVSVGTTTNAGSDTPPRPQCCGNLVNPTTGVFGERICYGIRDITDGSSNTIAIGEGLCGGTVANASMGQMIMGAGLAGPYLIDANQNPTAVLNDLQTCSNKFTPATAAQYVSVNPHGHWWSIGSMSGSMFNTIVPPNSTQYKWGSCRTDGVVGYDAGSADYSNAQSSHSGGCNFLFADGSVKFIKSTISIQTYWAIGTRANNETLSSDSY